MSILSYLVLILDAERQDMKKLEVDLYCNRVR